MISLMEAAETNSRYNPFPQAVWHNRVILGNAEIALMETHEVHGITKVEIHPGPIFTSIVITCKECGSVDISDYDTV